MFDIRNKKQEQQYLAVLETNIREKGKAPVYGFESYRFVGDIQKVIQLVRSKREQLRECLNGLKISDSDEPLSLEIASLAGL